MLPYYEESDLGQNEMEIPELEKLKGIQPAVYEEVSQLKNFWKRYNKVLIDVKSVKAKKEEIEKSNVAYKKVIKQYYDGFAVNDEVMKGKNTLLTIDNKVNPLDPTGDGRDTMLEAGKIAKDVSKQLNFVVNRITIGQ